MRKLVKQRLLFLGGSNKSYEVLEQHNDRMLEQKVPQEGKNWAQQHFTKQRNLSGPSK